MGQIAADDIGLKHSFRSTGTFVVQTEEIVLGITEQLLGACQRVLIGAALGGKAKLVVIAFDFDQLVDGTHGRGIAGGGKFGADSEGIDGRSGFEKCGDFGLVRDRRWP